MTSSTILGLAKPRKLFGSSSAVRQKFTIVEAPWNHRPVRVPGAGLVTFHWRRLRGSKDEESILEGVGVPPHIMVPLTIEDLDNGKDLALEKAMSL